MHEKVFSTLEILANFIGEECHFRVVFIGVALIMSEAEYLFIQLMMAHICFSVIYFFCTFGLLSFPYKEVHILCV